MHAIIGLRILSACRLLPQTTDWLAVPLVAVAVVGSLVGTEVFYRLVERPCQGLARRVRYRESTPSELEPPGPAAQ